MVKLAEHVGLNYSEAANGDELNCILIKVRLVIYSYCLHSSPLLISHSSLSEIYLAIIFKQIFSDSCYLQHNVMGMSQH